MSLDFGGLAGLWSAPLKWISLPVFGGIAGVITIYTCGLPPGNPQQWGFAGAHKCLSSVRTAFERLISNQVGLPAELKHINKRRKRN